MPPAGVAARRGSTHQLVQAREEPSGKHRIVQHGTWTPKNVAARLVFGACSDAGCSMDGRRKTNQDSFIAAVPQQFGSTALFATFDGHGENGHLVSQQVMNEFGRLLHSETVRRRDVGSAMVAAFAEQNQRCAAAVDCSQSGTTAVVCHLKADAATNSITCHTAWVGDSRAVLGRVRPDGQLGAIDLSIDQKPERPDEKARLQRSGALVEPVKDSRGQPVGPPRVWYLEQVAPGLAMSRSIGDTVGAMVGVTAEPEVGERVLQPEDALLVLASDGVWEFMSSQDVVRLVSEELRGKPITEQAVVAATRSLCDQVRQLWLREDKYVDDISATVLVMQQAAQRGGGAGAGVPDGAELREMEMQERQRQQELQQRQTAAAGAQKRSGVPLDPQLPPSPPQRNERASVAGLGPSGKRGAVSGESAGKLAMATRGTKELHRHKKSPERMHLILAAIQDPRHVIFQGMSDGARKAVAECMFMQHAQAGQAVIRQGEQGDIVYIVESGYFEAFLQQSGDVAVATYKSGDSFGELALMYSCARAATVKCVQPGVLWGLDRISYRTIIQQTSDSTNASLIKMLRSMAILQPLDMQQLSALANSLQIVTCQQGTSLLRRASIDALYILQAGSMDLSIDGGPVERVLPGGAIGELAVAGDGHSSQIATATATSSCVLARVTREVFGRHVGALQDIKRDHLNERSLSTVSSLAALTIAERRQLAKLMTTANYPHGHVIAKSGSEIAQLHIVHRGRVVVRPGGGGGFHGNAGTTAMISEGGVFGEGALLRNETAGGTYVADGDVLCMVVSRESVQRSLGPISSIVEREHQKAARKAQAVSIAFGNLRQSQILGMGTFGVVRLVQDTTSRATFALKTMSKQKVYEMGQVEHIIAECRLLSECEHPFIVQLVRTYEDERSLHLLLELTLGGELFSVLRSSPAGVFPERRCQFYSAMIVLAFEYLHDKRIIYRDLKPENLLFDADGYLKVVDFGFAKKIEERTWTVCGTPEYMSPEIILNKGHDKAVDWWTLGILLYEMLVGYPPFEGSDPMSLYKNIVKCDLRFPKMVAQQPLELISRLLTPEATERLGNLKGGADDVKRHPFFKRIVWHSLHLKKIEAPYKPTITSELDVSNFDVFEEPKEAHGRPTFPRGTYDEFSRLTRGYTAK